MTAGGLDDIGLAYDFAELKRHLDGILARFDHTCINDMPPFDRINASSENIAATIYDELRHRLADEPVSSVDPARARDTVELLVNLAREQNLTLIVSLHNADLAREFFPRLIGLRGGRVAFDKRASDTSDVEFQGLYELEQAS